MSGLFLCQTAKTTRFQPVTVVSVSEGVGYGGPWEGGGRSRTSGGHFLL